LINVVVPSGGELSRIRVVGPKKAFASAGKPANGRNFAVVRGYSAQPGMGALS
jgi:hypothetical protein